MGILHEMETPGEEANRSEPEDGELTLLPGGAATGRHAPKPPAGEETLRVDLPPGARPSAWSKGLAAWLLFTGCGALCFATMALVLVVAHGLRPTPWRAALVVFNIAVLVLVLRALVVQTGSARSVSRWTLGLGGLAATSLLLLLTVVRVGVRFVHATPPPQLLGEVLVFGLLGLASLVVYIQFLRRHPWAERAVALAGTAFLGTLAYMACTGGAARSAAPLLREKVGPAVPFGIGATVLASAALVAVWHVRSMRKHSVVRRIGGAVAICAAIGGAAWATQGFAGSDGSGAKVQAASTVAIIWQAAALLPMLLPAMAHAWRTGRPLREDAAAATQFVWLVVGIGVVAIVSVWLPMQRQPEFLEKGIVAAGLLSLLACAWLAQGEGNWAAPWVLLPVTGVTVSVLCAIGALTRYAAASAPSVGLSWVALTALGWASVCSALLLTCGGLAVKRDRVRAHESYLVQRRDAHTLVLGGLVTTGGLLAVMIVHWLGEAEVLERMAAAHAAALAFARDLLILALGSGLGCRLAGHASAIGDALSGSAGGFAAVLLLLLVVHLAAAAGTRWGAHLVALIWVIPLGAAAALTAAFAIRLPSPPPVPLLRTATGRYLGEHVTARALLFVFLALLIVRAWECVRCAGEVADAPFPTGGDNGGPPASLPVSAGLLVGAAGLGLALVWSGASGLEDAIVRLGLHGSEWFRSAVSLATHIGTLCASNGFYAGAVGLAALMLFAVHREAARQRLGAYPLLGTVWLVWLGVHVLRWVLWVRETPFEAGVSGWAPVAAIGLLHAALAAALFSLWGQWQSVQRQNRPDSLAPRDPLAAAHTLGNVGTWVLTAAVLVAAYAAFSQHALPGAAAGTVWNSASTLARETMTQLERARIALLGAELGRRTALVVGVSSAALLAVHLAAQKGMGVATALVFGVWGLAAISGAMALALALRQIAPGRWTGTALATWLLLALIVIAITISVIRGVLQQIRCASER